MMRVAVTWWRHTAGTKARSHSATWLATRWEVGVFSRRAAGRPPCPASRRAREDGRGVGIEDCGTLYIHTDVGRGVGVVRDSRLTIQTTTVTHHFLCRLISYDIIKNAQMFECGQLICFCYYTVSQKIWGTHIMPHNSSKYWSISIIFSLPYSWMNCRKRWY